MIPTRKPPSLRLVGADDVADWPDLGPIPGPGPEESSGLLINGFPARLVAWTAEEWRRLEAPPADAHAFPSGLRVALRIG
jgi:hypothetical protein